MRYVFYITNHGYGHASRNVPIIKNLLNRDFNTEVYIKTDALRVEFLKRNFGKNERIKYYEDCNEIGLVLKEGELLPNKETMKEAIEIDLLNWNQYIKREEHFLRDIVPDLVVSDVVCWAITSAKKCGIKTLLIGNFTWAQMYKSFYGSEIWTPYLRSYQLADKAIWYMIHASELEGYCKDYECVSMVSRPVNENNVRKIKNTYGGDIVFVSIGASAEIKDNIDVSELPFTFLTTRGVKLSGNNVYELPYDMINTPDYIAAAKYVIAKGGWSTVAEILIQKKKCALLFRGSNSEDDNTRSFLTKRNQCVALQGNELADIKSIIKKIDELKPYSYDDYVNDTKKICDIIESMVKENNKQSWN